MDINKISNRTILRILGMVTLFVVAIWLIIVLKRQITWIVIAAFFAVALNPAVNFLKKFLPRKSRGAAAAIVVFGSAAVVVLLIAAFVPSLIGQTVSLVNNFPAFLRDLDSSKAPFAELLRRYQVVGYVQQHQAQITGSLSGLGQPLLGAARGILGGLIGVLTVVSLTFFMLAEGQDWLNKLRNSRYGSTFKKLEPVTTDMYSAVSGYVVGNVATSILAGIAAAIMMAILGVPYVLPLAIVVAVFDLLPLVGATIAAVIVLIVCLFQSVWTALVMLIFFLIYQQFENQILQPMVYAKTVQISPLIVFIAALLGASLAGIIGALIAIPVAASIKILISYYFDVKAKRKA